MLFNILQNLHFGDSGLYICKTDWLGVWQFMSAVLTESSTSDCNIELLNHLSLMKNLLRIAVIVLLYLVVWIVLCLIKLVKTVLEFIKKL